MGSVVHALKQPTRDNPLTRLSVHIDTTYHEIDKLKLKVRLQQQQQHQLLQKQKQQQKQQYPPSHLQHSHQSMELKVPSTSSKITTTVIEETIRYDDEKDDYIFRENEIWHNRFKIVRRLGKGSFGQVFEAVDMSILDSAVAIKPEKFPPLSSAVAIKIIKNRKSFYNQALMEIKILKLLNEKDADDSKRIGWLVLYDLSSKISTVRMKEHFIHRNHLCIVYELLSVNLYEVIKMGSFTGLSLNLIRKVASQILSALRLLSRSDVQVIHCDLKPENRFYRSPEVILGHSYTMSIDIWSLGCILYELFSGEPLFSGQTEHDQLIRIIDLLGLPPRSMLDSASDAKITSMFQVLHSPSPPLPIYPSSTSYSKNTVSSAKPQIARANIANYNNTARIYRAIVPPTFKSRNTTFDALFQTKFQRALQLGKGAPHNFPPSKPNSISDTDNSPTIITVENPLRAYSAFSADFDRFKDLVVRMLVYDPNERITPEEALRHPFFSKSVMERETNTVLTISESGGQQRQQQSQGTSSMSVHGRGGLVGNL
ncbi:Dual specificity tyrosine-phosphorylation-regulated kinase 1A [Physocladia obscura]|uniref:Dual specificity tyrosine-phosphorylation-regulated kinase 1A n=1 Tax=Physocladia obscura TaxID=109957 RepID=A0AAD5TF12_9FUNG|nr:Dual specificity tyrosine-phosphorylation-regulated kinase 1A [Physocladia obscura]